jgi:hypothetical protein
VIGRGAQRLVKRGGPVTPRRSATMCAAMKVSPAPVTRVTSTSGGRR